MNVQDMRKKHPNIFPSITFLKINDYLNSSNDSSCSKTFVVVYDYLCFNC